MTQQLEDIAATWEKSAADTENNHGGAGLHYNQGVAEGLRICARDLRTNAVKQADALEQLRTFNNQLQKNTKIGSDTWHTHESIDDLLHELLD